MGAQQSTGQNDLSSDLGPAKTCYYELLAVDRQATDEEIKKAYRKKALELHPDRNYGNVEEATTKFAEVQTAYEVLSDPQERAWYDSHRESILKGDDGEHDGDPTTFRNVRLTSTEEIHQLMRRFNASVPFDDEPHGFFGITRETFEHLALEEEAACELDGPNCPDYPSFGSSDDTYEDVVRSFYSVWSGFSTRKSFAWKDKYRLSDAPDRQVRRLMEKENRKLRDDAAREYNDAVRFLVVFVRKRDPRYTPNTQTDSERQKALRDAAAAQAARARAANQEKMASSHVANWAQARDDSGVEDHFMESEEDEAESEEVEILECVICEKTFKSANQLEAHEKSKKHKQAVQRLRWRMKKEGAQLDIDTEPGPSKPPPSPPTGAKMNVHKDGWGVEVNADVSESDAVALSREAEDASGGHQKLRSASISVGEVEESRVASSGTDEPSDDDYAPRGAVEDRLASSKSSISHLDDSGLENELSAAAAKVELADETPQKKVGKAKAKRERKAAQSTAQSEKHQCTICVQEFSSRSKLFQHIRDEGHAAPVASVTQSNHKRKAKNKAR